MCKINELLKLKQFVLHGKSILNLLNGSVVSMHKDIVPVKGFLDKSSQVATTRFSIDYNKKTVSSSPHIVVLTQEGTDKYIELMKLQSASLMGN